MQTGIANSIKDRTKVINLYNNYLKLNNAFKFLIYPPYLKQKENYRYNLMHYFLKFL